MDDRKWILNELRTLITENLELEAPEALDESMRLYDDLQIDSIMVLQLMVYIEEVFQVSLPDEGVDPEHFLTIGSLAELIESFRRTAV
ncbi:acyl carrier protein [Paenibacillus albicereus]|uniref:Acyl carrier protein n=1 Tax=Paenibacillus albicereus TaxID=2726185 RepID=A0A6H2H0S1_9BACL|nr:phosphopantetheine-binding protein [Paenibacillus albicereus]QJC53260.1 acyl carrier protein [Paenibacillus albicereus]